MKDQFHIADLIVKQIKGSISADESLELTNWINESEENRKTYERAIDTKTLLKKVDSYKQFNQERVWAAIEEASSERKIRTLTTQKYLRYAAAILIPVSIVAGLLFYSNWNPNQPTLATIDEYVTPGTEKALLILSDGGQIDLDGINAPSQLNDGDVAINNKDKTLEYESATEGINQPLIFNQLITPKGGKYSIKLADGSQVWLNAGSSLKFPVAFNDTVRRVYLKGEAFFDVQHNGKPFIVTSENMDVRVLGTTFNINAYEDEAVISTTLVTGKVRITPNQNITDFEPVLLTPNNQAVLRRDNQHIEVNEAKTSQYTSWLDGKIEFNAETMDAVMRKLARWYDFEFEFKNEAARNYHFSGRISNTESFSSILEMLQMTTAVKFEIDGNKIIVQ